MRFMLFVPVEDPLPIEVASRRPVTRFGAIEARAFADG